MDHKAFSRKGGKARSAAKTLANRAKAAAYWEAVRGGRRAAPGRPGAALDAESIGRLLSGYCRQNRIMRLEAFGPVARGDSGRGLGIDLIATFPGDPGARLGSMEGKMAAILGAPVRLLARGTVDQMANPFRRASILADARVIFNDA
jgi:predicted nucleotidyltransferase